MDHISKYRVLSICGRIDSSQPVPINAKLNESVYMLFIFDSNYSKNSERVNGSVYFLSRIFSRHGSLIVL